MSISSQRAALRKSAINLDRIRSSLRTFGRGITSAKIQTDEILKQTRERNNFKSTLINQDEKFFRLRQENIKRKSREDALEATSINGSTKLQGSILEKSTRGFLGRMLNFLGILLIGWSVKNLPRIIKGIETLKKNITDSVGILTDFMSGVTDTLLGIGVGLSEFFSRFRRFDFTLNRRAMMEQINKIINSSVLLNKNLVTAFNKFENDPDLNKAIEDSKNGGGEDGGDEELNFEEDVTKQLDRQFDEKTSNKIRDAIKEPFEIETKKAILDLDSFFNKNKQEGDGEGGEGDLSTKEYDDIEKQLNEFELKTEGLSEKLTKDISELEAIEPNADDVKLANFLAMDVDKVFNVGRAAVADLREKVNIACNNEDKGSDEGPDLSFNHYKPNQNMDFGNSKKKRDTIFIVERPVGNGINVSGNSGGDTNVTIKRGNPFDTFNTIQSAQLKYT